MRTVHWALSQRAVPSGVREVVVVALVALALFLVPAGVRAASSLVTIAGPGGVGKAHVAHGKLLVGDGRGPLTIDGHVNVSAGAPILVTDAPSKPITLVEKEQLQPNTVATGGIVYTVPPGKRLVVETASVEFDVPATEHPSSFVGLTRSEGPNATFRLEVPLVAQGQRTGTSFWAGTVSARVYVEPGQQVLSSFGRDASSGTAGAILSVSGYLVPAGPA